MVIPRGAHGFGRARRFLAAALLLLAPASCAHVPAGDGASPAPPSGGTAVFSVRVTFRDAPVPGARATWLRSIVPGEDAPVLSGAAGGDGVLVSSLSPGRYFLVVRWRADGDYSRRDAPGDRYAYFGGNPLYASAGEAREVFVGLEECVPPPGMAGLPPGGTGVAGIVTSGGSPVSGAHVHAYHRTGTAFRDPGFAASAPTGPDGSFVMEVPPGDYYLVARRREGGGIAGPMRKGDLFGYYHGNPVAVPEGGYARVAIPATVLKLRNAPSYSAGYKAAAFVEGRILGVEGKPRAGVYAALYDNPDLLNRPVFLSDVTGEDGAYRLPVPVPGKYYLGARSGYGGSPAPGDFYGRYEGNPEHAVVLRDGDRLVGIDIVVGLVR